jgi:hypothetical protein
MATPTPQVIYEPITAISAGHQTFLVGEEYAKEDIPRGMADLFVRSDLPERETQTARLRYQRAEFENIATREVHLEDVSHRTPRHRTAGSAPSPTPPSPMAAASRPARWSTPGIRATWRTRSCS